MTAKVRKLAMDVLNAKLEKMQTKNDKDMDILDRLLVKSNDGEAVRQYYFDT